MYVCIHVDTTKLNVTTLGRYGKSRDLRIQILVPSTLNSYSNYCQTFGLHYLNIFK